MTQVFWAFPEVDVRDDEPRQRTRRGNGHSKYPHWAMLQDRLAGMSWPAIEAKYGVTAGSKPGKAASHCVMRSAAAKKLTPREVERAFPRMALDLMPLRASRPVPPAALPSPATALVS